MPVLPGLSVVIPAIDEAAVLPFALASARAPGVECIVADGGSLDRTADVARAHGARVVRAPAGRGPQLAAGARAARAPSLLFLHADARLPAGFTGAVERVLRDPRVALGAFSLRIDDPRPALRLVEWGVRQRCRWLALPFGDQGLFLRAETYRQLGGFAPLRAMEDLDLVRRARRFGAVRTVAEAVLVSARAWQRRGVLSETARNATALVAYHMGMNPDRIAASIRTSTGTRLSENGRNAEVAPRTLFLCVGNSARSQMAEGLARATLPAGSVVASAGSQPKGVHPLAVRALREIGIDISQASSSSVAAVDVASFDVVITLCAEEVCPAVPGAGVARLHWPHEDPAAADDEARLAAFRRVRDALRRRLREWCAAGWPLS